MGSFATWGDLAQDSMLHGLEWALAFGFTALLMAWGVGKLAELYRQLL